jgi:hypothetical protein
MSQLVATYIGQCPDVVTARRHFEYILDAFPSVASHLPCRAWLELNREGNTTSKIAHARTKGLLELTREEGACPMYQITCMFNNSSKTQNMGVTIVFQSREI